jgi:ribulose-5-phosphate 4-epimerase/fuculose-1-phosphate aldolase
MEEKTRLKLAALHRIMDYYGWTDLILNHISARVKNEQGQDCYFMNPFGLLYSEVTKSNIVSIDKYGELVNSNNTYHSNPAGFVIHSAIYEARSDVNCIIHTHTPNGIAISNLKEGLVCLDQMGLIFHQSISYHELEGIAVNPEEKLRLAADLRNNDCIILRNHGLLSTGRTIEDAFWNYYYLEMACKVQLLVFATGRSLNEISQMVKQKTYDQHYQYNKHSGTTRKDYPSNAQLAFDALMRMLDRIDDSYRV